MLINKNIKNVASDLYYHDIVSCHFNVLKLLGYDISNFSSDKRERNIQIGILQKNNPNLTKELRRVTIETVDKYLEKNNIQEDDIVVRQYDGVILTRRMKDVSFLSPLEMPVRNYFVNFIISLDRKKYLAITDDRSVIVKGVPNTYDKIQKFYKEFVNINFQNRKAIFKTLQKIKDQIMNSEDVTVFLKPILKNRKGLEFEVCLLKYGKLSISKSAVDMLDHSDIDKEYYFQIYFKPFADTIYLTFC